MDQSSFTLSALGGAEFQAFAAGFPIVLAHVGVTLLMLMVGATLYALLTLANWAWVLRVALP